MSPNPGIVTRSRVRAIKLEALLEAARAYAGGNACGEKTIENLCVAAVRWHEAEQDAAKPTPMRLTPAAFSALADLGDGRDISHINRCTLRSLQSKGLVYTVGISRDVWSRTEAGDARLAEGPS